MEIFVLLQLQGGKHQAGQFLLLLVGLLVLLHLHACVHIAGGFVLAWSSDAGGEAAGGVGVAGGQVAVLELALGVGAVDALPAPAVSPGGLLVVGHATHVLLGVFLCAPLPALDVHIPH